MILTRRERPRIGRARRLDRLYGVDAGLQRAVWRVGLHSDEVGGSEVGPRRERPTPCLSVTEDHGVPLRVRRGSLRAVPGPAAQLLGTVAFGHDRADAKTGNLQHRDGVTHA